MAVENRTGYFASPHKTAAEFTSENVVLAKGVTGTESDTYKTKCGDGISDWNTLNYNPGTSVASTATSKFKPLTVGSAGDSIGLMWGLEDRLSPIWWFKSLINPCSIDQVFNSSVGGTKSANLLEIEGIYPAQIDALLALPTKPDLMTIHTTQNDSFSSYAGTDVIASYVKDYATQILAAGVKNIIIAGHPPNNGASVGSPIYIEYLNSVLSAFADKTDGVHFIDVLSLWRERPIVPYDGFVVGWRPGYTVDNTHPVDIAMYEVSKLLTPILAPLVQSKTMQTASSLTYDPIDAPYANLLGADGLMIGTNGFYNAVLNTNVCGSSAEYGEHWLLTDENGVTATPSIVTGDDGYIYQQLVLGGTATADASIDLLKLCFKEILIGQYRSETKLYLTDIENVDEIRITGMSGYSTLMDSGFSLTGENEFQINWEAALESDSFQSPSPSMFLKVLSGQSPTGTVKIGRCSTYRLLD